MKVPIWLFIFLIVLCAYSLIKLLKSLLKYINIKRKGIIAEGTFIDYQRNIDNDGVTYPSVIEYYTVKREKVVAVSVTGSGVKPKIGSKVTIIYDPENTSHFYFQKSSAPVVLLIGITAFSTVLVILIIELYKT